MIGGDGVAGVHGVSDFTCWDVLALLVRYASAHEHNTQAGPTRCTYAGEHALSHSLSLTLTLSLSLSLSHSHSLALSHSLSLSGGGGGVHGVSSASFVSSWVFLSVERGLRLSWPLPSTLKQAHDGLLTRVDTLSPSLSLPLSRTLSLSRVCE